MFQIRREQMKVFEEVAWLRFEDEMVIHSQEFSPRLCKVLGKEQLRVALRQAIKRARAYGFSYRGPIRLYIELMFLFGSDFDTDPQYPIFHVILNTPGDQMQRAEQMHAEVGEYIDKVAGTNNINVRRSLEKLSVLAQNPFTFSSGDFVAGMLQEMTRTFPQKTVYVGEVGLTSMIHEGRKEARKYGFNTVREEALIVVLMYAFGHGCTDDPLYPWISRTLKDERIIDPPARARRLERKAITWLDQVLARPGEGAQT